MKMYAIEISDVERRLLVDALEAQLTAGKADAVWLLMNKLNDLETDEAENGVHELFGDE